MSILKEIFLNRHSQNAKQVGVLQNICDEEFWRGPPEKFSKTWRLLTFTGRRGEMNQNSVYIYRRDNLDGHSSNVCTENRFFYEEILFLRKELDHKQKTIDNLSKIINHMHTNSNESGENIHKNTNTQPIQINATAEEQGRNNVTVDDITYNDIPLNRTQSEVH